MGSFAPAKELIGTAMGGYDAHFLALVDSENANQALNINSMRGLLVFNQDSATGVDVEGNKTTKVSINHISCVNISELELIFDLALDFIWKTMHCASIRIQCHYIHIDGQLVL